MNIGLNISFAVKRWMIPENLAAMISQDLFAKRIQFTWDIIDPWWPEAKRDALARRWAEAFRKEGLSIDSYFMGLGGYTYGQLLAPLQEQREIAETFLRRAIDTALALGVKTIGMPLGGMSSEHANDPALRVQRYTSMLESLARLAEYARAQGTEKILIEATPLLTEFPHSPGASLKLMKDLDGRTAIPIRLLVDWGHALFKPLLGAEADMSLWLKTCAPYVDCLHLQQTDGLLDRHWDFTVDGIVSLDLIKQVAKETGSEGLVQYVEVIYPFEATDEVVLTGMKKTMSLLCSEGNDGR